MFKHLKKDKKNFEIVNNIFKKLKKALRKNLKQLKKDKNSLKNVRKV